MRPPTFTERLLYALLSPVALLVNRLAAVADEALEDLEDPEE